MSHSDCPFRPVETAPSLDALLRVRAELHGARTVFTYLDYVGPPQGLTYRELDERARSIAAHLQERGAFGERILLIFPQGLDFIAAFFGCLYAGAIAVPAYPPRRNQKATRIETILADCQARFALCDRDTLDGLQARFDDWPHLAALDWMAVEDLAASPDTWREPPQDAQRPAFLQFTSGSTGDPKGVIVTHANILSNQTHIGRAFQQQAGFNCGGWLPMYHDMGLIGNLLHPLCWGGNLTFMSPVAFLQQPIRWLRMISDYRVSISGAPNFAYQLCVDETTAEQRQGLDLSCWEVAYNGSEPIHPQTLRRFAEAFAPYGFSAEALCPCYGMAETTLLVSGAHPRQVIVTCQVDAQALSQGHIEPQDSVTAAPASDPQDRKSIELVACGAPDPDFDVQIVDPETRQPCPPGQIGEIWLAGPSVAAGYWGRPEITAAQFAATLANNNTDGEPCRYLRTGDLGFVRDGQLYITGRLKDLLIVRGANHYPQDIERTVAASHPGLAADAGAVFALPGIDGGPERVVAVNELKREFVRTANHDEIFAAIRQAVAAEHELNLETIVLLRTVSIPKTSSGKIQRSLTRQRFEADDLKIVARWDRSEAQGEFEAADIEQTVAAEHAASSQPASARTALSHDQRQQIAALERWMIGRLAARLRLAPHQIHPRQPFASLGVDSLTAVRLAGELEEHLGRSVPATVAWDHRHVAGLAYFLVTGQSEEAAAATVAPGDPQEPLAVVGIGCRLPGADSADAFWDMLRRGECAIGQQPRDRWGAALQTAAQRSGRPLPDRGGYVDGVELFDPGFFGISPREAAEMDPQQRLLLETAWEALEHAGISPDRLSGTRGGVFIGVSGGDYARLQSAAWHTPGGHTATGGSLAIAASRLSYHFDLRGPCLTIDTACSSSLVAVHQAVVSLRRGECDLALAGGVSLILAPDTTASFNCQAGMLSPRGLCQAFAAAAEGFVRGEGCGVAVLKRLSQAVADGDRILAVIRGSAVNQDGRSNGLTAPNGLAQQQVIRSALADGNVAAQAVDYVEAHGTGTPLGDPIEMGAIGAVYGQQRSNRLAVGSVKTNVGHLEGAAGIAGLMKTCLALYHGQIPPHLHFDRPSPHIDWSLPIDIAAAGQAWTRGERPRLAGVSSFGFGGTNAHVVLEEAPCQDLVNACHGSVSRAPSVLVLSTKTATALKTLVARYQEHLTELPADCWPDVCATAAMGRAALQHRLALVADDAGQARELLASFAADKPSSAILQGAPASAPAIAWLFTGQGHSPFGAAQRWYETYAGFRQKLDQVAEVLAGYWPRPVKQLLWEDGPWQHTTDVQPALFALQYAWAAWWQELGILPQAVVGHSLGEYAAACLAGVFSLEDAAKLVTCRARLIGQLSEAGGMLAVAASAEQLAPYLADADALRISLAAINGARQTVVAGADQGLTTLADRLISAGIGAKRLATTHAFHSPLLDEVLPAFEATAQTVQYQRPQLAYLSALLGDWDNEQVATPSYWRRQLREPVRFAAALHELPEQATLWAEIGPGSVLSRLAKQQQTSQTQPPTILSGWPDAASEERYLLEQLARLWTAGVAIDWQAFYGQQPRKVQRVTLPSYPFERKRYWFTTSAIEAPKSENFAADASLPGRRLDLAGESIVFETDLAAHGYLADHVVAGSAVFPASGYLALALAAAAEVQPQQHLELTDVQFLRPLAFTPGESCRVQTVLTPGPDDTAYQVQFARREADRWRTYATAALKPADMQTTNGAPLAEPEGQAIDPAEHYRRCRQVGLAYGPAFQGVQKLVRLTGGAAWGQVCLPQSLHSGDESTTNTLHPALLDACFQVAAAAFDSESSGAWLPIGVNHLRHFKTPAADERLHVSAQLQPTAAPHQMQVHLTIATADGHTVATVDGFTLHQADLPAMPAVDAAADTPGDADLLFQDTWLPQVRQQAHQAAVVVPAAELAAAAAAAREGIAQRTALRQHRQFLSELEQQSARLAARALRALGVPLDAGARFDAETLATELEVAPVQRRLFHRLLTICVEEGWLACEAGRYRVLAPPPADASIAPLAARYPAGLPEITLVDRCGQQLADVLLGELDPLPLLFPRDGSPGAAEVYRESSGGQAMNSLVAETVAAIARRLPPGRGLRILEIGAGTGGTTSALLPLLPADRTHYVFTDIAAGFMAKAAEQLAAYPFIEYRTLDVEADPAAQGFEPGSFDVVIAANVLHATADLHQALAHAAWLTAPAGQLILLEGTRPIRWMDLTFGLTKGWWRFADDARADYPLVNGAVWQRLLTAAGFEQAELVSPLPELDTAEAESLVVVGCRRAEAKQNTNRGRVHLAGDAAVTQPLLKCLAAHGCACQATALADAPAVWALDPAASNGNGHPPGTDPWRGELPTDAVLFAPQLPPETSDADLPQLVQQAMLDVLAAVQALDASVRVAAAAGHTAAPPRLWIVTRGAQATADEEPLARDGLVGAGLWGFVRSLALERPDWPCHLVDGDPANSHDETAAILADELLAGATAERELAFRRGVRLVRRLKRAAVDGPPGDVALDRSQTNRVLKIDQRGTLAALHLVAEERRLPAPHQIEVAVAAAGLNFRDVLNALGLYPGQPPLGAECVGRVVAVGSQVTDLMPGDAVAVIAPDAFADLVTIDAVAAVKLPGGWQHAWAQTATLPVAFLTAHVALEQLAGMAAGQRVLIHAAAGGVGLAAVQLATAVGAEVFATASLNKHAALHDRGIKHVFVSRSAEFGQQVAQAAGGGVDIILNSLPAEFLQANLACLAKGGVLVDIAKHPVDLARQIAAVRPDVRYHQLDLSALLAQEPQRVQRSLGEILARVHRGELKPLPCQTFALSDAQAAFRTLQQAQHVGKIVVVADAADRTAQPTENEKAPALAVGNTKPTVRGDRTYLITGGLGGLGLLTARHLAELGARHVALLARREPSAAEAAQISTLRQQGVNVRLLAADIADAQQLEQALQTLRATAPPLAGVFHLAGVLDNAALASQTPASMAKVLAPKVVGGWNLHQATLADPLEHFVLFASAAGFLGSPGQLNHAAANQFLAALAAYRRGLGLPALSIDWGPWSEVGAAAALSEQQLKHLGGVAPINPGQGLALLDRCLAGNQARLAALWLRLEQMPEGWRASPLFELLKPATADEAHVKTSAFLESYQLAAAGSRWGMLLDHLREQLARVLGMEDPASIAAETPFAALGLDSLTSLELRNALEASLGRQLPASLIFDYPTLAELVQYFVGVLPQDGPDAAAGGSNASANTGDHETASKECMPSLANQDGALIELGSQGQSAEVLPVGAAHEATGNSHPPGSGTQEVMDELLSLTAELEQWGNASE